MPYLGAHCRIFDEIYGPMNEIFQPQLYARKLKQTHSSRRIKFAQQIDIRARLRVSARYRPEQVQRLQSGGAQLTFAGF